MRARRAIGGALAALGAAGVAACGSDDSERVNRDRPAAPINVTAAIIDGHVNVSPRSFGAGPVRLLVTNQTASPQALTFETDEVGGDQPGLKRRTDPIQPTATAVLEVDVRKGDYRIATSDDGVQPAKVTVGDARPSAQNELLQPCRGPATRRGRSAVPVSAVSPCGNAQASNIVLGGIDWQISDQPRTSLSLLSPRAPTCPTPFNSPASTSPSSVRSLPPPTPPASPITRRTRRTCARRWPRRTWPTPQRP